MIKAITIDPYLKIISELEIEGDLKSLQHAIGDNNIEAVYIHNNDVMYVDDEGLFKENQMFFIYDGRSFAGKAIIVGVDYKNGKDLDANSNPLEVYKNVGFCTTDEIIKMNLER